MSTPDRSAPSQFGENRASTKPGALHYDPATGRFTQQDSVEVLADPARGNRYQYAGDNPINYVDPTGRYYTEFSLWPPRYVYYLNREEAAWAAAAFTIGAPFLDFIPYAGPALAAYGEVLGAVAEYAEGAGACVGLTLFGLSGLSFGVGVPFTHAGPYCV